MLSSVKTNYIYRFLNRNQPVYIIKRVSKNVDQTAVNQIHLDHIFTEPFHSKERKDVHNTIIAFTNADICKKHINAINIEYEDCTDAVDATHDIIDMEVKLKDLLYMSYMINMPLIVIMNMYCCTTEKEHCVEAYYFNNINKQSNILY